MTVRRRLISLLSVFAITVACLAAVAITPASAAPSLPVGTGPVPGGSFLTFNLTDRLQALVNVGSGNLLVRSTDLVLRGIEGGVVLGADYNSLDIGSSIETGAFGHGWHSRSGIDVHLIANSGGTVTFVAPDGVVGTFSPVTGTSNYTSPAVFKATLVKISSGWNLTAHNSGQVISFNSSGKPVTITDRNGNVITVSYNSSGQQTKITSDWGPSTIRAGATAYGSNGFISSFTQTGTDVTTHTVGYGYDSSGNLASITDPDGNIYTLGYDSSHNLTSITTPTTSTDPAGPDNVTSFTYDSAHRVTSITRLLAQKGSSNTATTRLSYVSSTETQVADPNTDQTQPVANVPNTTYTLDSQQRVTKVADQAGNSSSFSYDSFSDVKTYTDALGNVSTNTYGANSGESLTNAATPMGASTSFAYANAPTTTNPTANFQVSSSTDPQGNATAYTYNGAGNLASAKNALAAVSSVAYNSDGTVHSSTDPMNGTNATTYAYNSDHQLTTVTPPTGNNLAAYSYTYDAFGRVLTVTDGASRETTFGYDADGRVTSVSYNDGTITVTFTYDGSGNLIQRIDQSGTTAYTYDLANQMLTRNNSADGKTLLYTYDLDGNLTSVTDGRGNTTYTYDSRNLLTSMATDKGATLYTFSYDADGRRTATYFNTVTGNTTWTARTLTSYDKSGRITRITTALNSNPSNLVFDTSYCYSPFVSGQSCPTSSSTTDTGLLKYSTDNLTGKVSIYSSDKGNRLTGATNVAGHTYGYAYDADGNRTSVTTDGATTQSLTYNSANQISTSGYSYDGAGNMTAAPGASYGYNAAEEMTSSTVNGVATPHVYAGGTQRELTSAGTNQFIWGRDDQFGQPWLQSFNTNGGSQVYVERDESGAPLGLHIAGHDYFLVTDNLGSVVAVIDTAGNVAAQYSYDPYGVTVSASEGGLGGVPNIIRYAGGAFDQSTGLTKFGQRYYTPGLGTFTQQDANQILANPSNGNLYAYAGDNPANYTDPTGLCSWPTDCLEFIAGYTVGAAVTFGTIGGAIGCTLAGGLFDPPGCGLAWTGGAAIGSTIGTFAGLGYSIGYIAAQELFGP